MRPSKEVIVLTGGHAATVGISVIEEIKRRFPSLKICYIGSKTAIPGSKATTTEYKIYPSLGVDYYSITAGKLQTKYTRYTIPLILMIPLGFIQTFFLLLKIRPRVILSLGGFASFPVVVWGFLFGIPVILHEQTVVYGRASRVSAPFASGIALARMESLKYFPRGKSKVTGNPLLPGILRIKPKVAPNKNKVIFINIGSRGSRFISEEVRKILPNLLKKYEVFHIVGENDFEKFKNLAGDRYHVFSFVDPREIADFYAKADIIIARAGASTVSEILYVKRPAILIPLPATFMDEQSKNAAYARDFGIARVLQERDVNSESLEKEIALVDEKWSEIVNSVIKKPSPDANASQKVVDLLEKYVL